MKTPKIPCFLINEFGELKRYYATVQEKENYYFVKAKSFFGQTVFEGLIEKDKLNLLRYKKKLHILIPKKSINLDNTIAMSSQEFQDILDSLVATSTSLLTLTYFRYFIIVLISSIAAAAASIIAAIK